MLRAEGIAREPIDDAAVIDALVARVVEDLAGVELDLLINDCCFKEEKRLRGSRDAEEQQYLASLREARRRLAWASRGELEDILRGIVQGYATEIHGHFDPKIYANATRILPRGLALLLRNQKPWQLLTRSFRGEQLTLSDRIRVGGELAAFDRLVEVGTCVLVPTHLSNLDSPAIGFALHQAGLPPMIYGAGKNLFSNWLLSYFMDHLGAYKVDREKQNDLYKICLKEYSALGLENRWHSLFFPGGTRSRSGRVESKLKKGLMGTALTAYQRNLREGREKPRIFFVPATINYHLVLEAETLIDDHLQEAGRSRYIITDDEFSRPDKVLHFVRGMMSLSNPVEVVFGQAMDPFGNPVNADGDSLDPSGRPFDPAGYLCQGGEVVADEQRDREYTRRLSEAIGRAFLRDTVLFDTHVLCAAAHRRLEAHHPQLGLYRRLLLGPDARRFAVQEIDAEVRLLQEALRGLEAQGRVRLGESVRDGSARDLRDSAIKHLGSYHSARALTSGDGVLELTDPRLALYYANRLQGYPLPNALPPGGAR